MRDDAEARQAAGKLIVTRRERAAWWPWFVVAYVAAVLLIDALATVPPSLPNPYGTEVRPMRALVSALDSVLPAPLASLQWRPAHVSALLGHTPLPEWTHTWLRRPLFAQFDVFKFVFWFLVPLALCGRRVDLAAFTLRRWRKPDKYIFAAACVLGFLAVCLVPYIPGLREAYGAGGSLGMPFGDKLYAAMRQFIWVISWLVGWEFMHRYFLLEAVRPRWPRFGWLLAPAFEFLYHLQKFWLEALGMFLFSLLASIYVIRRNNVSLPFLAHLLIEIALPLTLLFSALNPLHWVLG